MEESPTAKANLFSASQGILCILLNSIVHYLIHKTTQVVHIQSQINPVHELSSHST